LLSQLRSAHLLHRALAIVRLVCPGLCRVQTAKAKDLHAVRLAGLSCRGELVRRVYLLRTAKATQVPRLGRALPLPRAADGRRACLFHAQMVMAIRLTRAPALHPAPHDPLCHADQAYLPARDPRSLDSSPAPVPGCPPRARRHELAAEHSLDFPL
jgi:hypothetical protein